ncbi:MAG TPA: hypothetical protein PLA88_04615 [Bacteroidales bacterium]|nr:hypothetical protein [Bacteroidales bacterium]
MKYKNIKEEELKNKVSQDYFWLYDCSRIIGNIDYCVCMIENQPSLFEQESLLWAEAKRGSSDIYNSITQLILTIGKARTFDKFLPPPMLGAFDGEKIAFIPYSDIHEIFYQNDFNWNVTPSDYNTKEFQLVHKKVKDTIDQKALLFHYEHDDKELKNFIRHNFVVGKLGLTKTKIDKNNFMVIYTKWLRDVKPTIAVNWEAARKNGIIDGDFYLADLLSEENNTLKDNLFVVLKATKYEFNRFKDEYGALTSSSVDFNDSQKAHTQFWNRYDRPPKEEYWDYIVERRDLLVPQDIRERKGSFFTPQIWVEMSQKYLTDVLGEDWQDEYYIWDCAAGTGNLLNGLTNKYNIWASTLDKQDVEIMHDRIKNGANLLEDHVFQFDFLNDDFSKLPMPLQNIINDPDKRKKIVMYINPPYAEAGNTKQKSGTGTNKSKTSIENKTYLKYKDKIGKASNEISAQFLIRIFFEITDSIIANFSKLKSLQSSNFNEFRKIFDPKLERLFLVQANTFDNVKGQFPIGFFIWNSKTKESFNQIFADVFNKNGDIICQKNICNYDNLKGRINTWLSSRSKNLAPPIIGQIHSNSNDFQHQNDVFIDNESGKKTFGGLHVSISYTNLIEASILYAVRHCVEATWLNDRDQFLYPDNKWKEDQEFQGNCITYTLFSNNIQSKYGPNHWIPFTEYEVGSREKFESDFMIQFIQGKGNPTMVQEALFDYPSHPKQNAPLEFSPEAQAVFNAGRQLWKYYHKQPDCNVNASLYDIREYFQGRNEQGKMNNKSEDETYSNLISDLRESLKILAKKIEPKVYEYGFLKQ